MVAKKHPLPLLTSVEKELLYSCRYTVYIVRQPTLLRDLLIMCHFKNLTGFSKIIIIFIIKFQTCYIIEIYSVMLIFDLSLSFGSKLLSI